MDWFVMALFIGCVFVGTDGTHALAVCKRLLQLYCGMRAALWGLRCHYQNTTLVTLLCSDCCMVKRFWEAHVHRG